MSTDLDDVVDTQSWGSTTYAELIGWHSGYGKGYRVYSIEHIAPTITSFGNILILDDRYPGDEGIRLLTVNEMARLSSFDNETIRFLESIPEDEALKAIANAVPMGLLSTVYTAVLDHAHATEFAYVATRHKNYDEPDHTLLPDRVLRAVDPDRAPPHREQRRVTFGGTTFAPAPTTPATPPKPRSPQPTRPPPPTKPTIAARTSTNSSAAVSDPTINPSEPQPSDGALPTTSTSPTASSTSSYRRRRCSLTTRVQ